MMKNIVHVLSVSSLLFFSANNSFADTLCQRKVKSDSSTMLKLAKGTQCPRGYSKIGSILNSEEISELIKTQIATNITPQSLQGPQGAKGATGSTGATGSAGAQGLTGVTGATGAQGIRGNQGVTGQKGDKGEKGEIGLEGERGAQGPAGVTAIDLCYTTSLTKTGTGSLTQEVYCDTPDEEFVQHVGYSLNQDEAVTVREILLYEDTLANPYQHPVGASVRSFRPASANPDYTLSVTLLCCPVLVGTKIVE